METMTQAIEQAEKRQDCATLALQMKRHVAELDLQIRQQEAAIRAAIAAEVTEDGKAVFSNDVKRDAEFIGRAANNEALTALRAEREKLDFGANGSLINAEFHRDMVRILCAFAETNHA